MPAKKGTRPPNAGKGRKKGVPNRHRLPLSTREALVAFVNRNANNAQALYDRVQKRQPAVALALLAKIAEFVEPKLLRAEVKAELNHTREYTGEVIDITDQIDASRVYQEMIRGDRDARSLNFVVSEQKPVVAPSLPAPVAPPRPRLEVFEAAGKPVDVRFTTRPCIQEPVEVPAVATDAAPSPAIAATPARRPTPEAEPETGGVLASGMVHEHVHTAKADSVCPRCHHLWVIS
jgi:hypothetical protein